MQTPLDAALVIGIGLVGVFAGLGLAGWALHRVLR
jgi:hypothetical protein